MILKNVLKNFRDTMKLDSKRFLGLQKFFSMKYNRKTFYIQQNQQFLRIYQRFFKESFKKI